MSVSSLPGAYSESVVDCVEILGCKSVVSDCAANDLGDGTEEEPPCRSGEDDGSECRVRGGGSEDQISRSQPLTVWGLLPAPL